MSKHSRSGSPQRSASSAAAAAPPAGPLSTVSAAWSAAASSAARPPLDCMIAGVGRPASRDGVEQRGAGSAPAGGRGRRRPRSSRRARTRGRCRRPRATARRGRRGARAARRRSRARGRGGDSCAAGRRRPPRARRRATASTSALEVGQRLEHAVGPGPLARGEAPLGRRQRRRVRGAQPVELAPRLAAEGDDVGEAVGGDERGARDRALQQRVGGDRHAVGEALDVARAAAPAASSARSTAAMTPARLVVGRRRRLGRVHDARRRRGRHP